MTFRLKTSPHWMVGGGQVEECIAAGCSSVKMVGCFPDIDFRGAMTIGRTPDIHQLDRDRDYGKDPRAVAAWYFETNLRQHVTDNPRVTVWSGPNEFIVDDADQMRWYSKVLYHLAAIIRSTGKTPAIGGWSVGNPAPYLWKYYEPALRACEELGAYFERHSYGPLTREYALRHRLDHQIFSDMGFRNIPMLITECGADNAGGMTAWRNYYQNLDAYWNEWIVPFEIEIRKDPYVKTANLYTFGTGGSDDWKPYDVGNTDIGQRFKELADRLGPLEIPMPATNQKVINAFYKTFGATRFWAAIIACGLTGMALSRLAQYTGPSIDDLPLWGADRRKIKSYLAG